MFDEAVARPWRIAHERGTGGIRVHRDWSVDHLCDRARSLFAARLVH